MKSDILVRCIDERWTFEIDLQLSIGDLFSFCYDPNEGEQQKVYVVVKRQYMEGLLEIFVERVDDVRLWI